MHQYGSLGVPPTPKSHDALIEVFKFIRNKLHFCTNIESETLKIYSEVCEPFRRSEPSVWHSSIASNFESTLGGLSFDFDAQPDMPPHN